MSVKKKEVIRILNFIEHQNQDSLTNEMNFIKFKKDKENKRDQKIYSKEKKIFIDYIFFLLRVKRHNENYPFSFLQEGDHYLSCFASLDTNKEMFIYSNGPVVDSLTLYSFAAKQIAKYFIPNKKNESNFLLDFYELLKDYEVKLEEINLDPLVIDLNYTDLNHFSFMLRDITNIKKLFFKYINYDVLCDNEIDASEIKSDLIRSTDDYEYNSSLIFRDLLQLQFYANHEKIKQSLPPQIKRLIVVSRLPETRTKQERDEGKEVAEGVKTEYIVYDSSKTLEEMTIDNLWLHKGKPGYIIKSNVIK